MSGFVVEVFSSVADHRTSAWLTELDGVVCVVSDRSGATVFPTPQVAEDAARHYAFLYEGRIASWAVKPS